MFENLIADIKRFNEPNVEGLKVRQIVSGLLSQGFQALLVYRIFRWLYMKKIPAQPFRFLMERLIEITTGISIPVRAEIGRGLRIHHFGGIILHPSVKIGENCTLYHGVTIGDKGDGGLAANIGNNVLIGAGAKIIGEITIGDNCKIGANSVVIESIPENSVVVGVPGKIVKNVMP